MKTAAPTLDARILEEAADWLMQLHDGGLSAAQREACERWRQRSPEHARAWARAELLMNKLGGLPASLAMPALVRQPAVSRRAAGLKLAAWLAAAPVGLLSWQLLGGTGAGADHHTAKGERRELRLADGSRVTLNTATALDVRFDARQRLLHLRAGEILVQTAPSPAGAAYRPLRVFTAEGRMEALGTRFSVRQEGERSHVAVLEGAVRVEPQRGGASAVQTLQAGQQAFLGATELAPVEGADEALMSWTRGMLLADNMRLADFAADLQRYRSGLLHCDPRIAELRVSGAFPLADTDRALAMLVSTYPVVALRRLRGRWVTLAPRAD